MTRWHATAPGARARALKRADGVRVPPGMLSIPKAEREERIANRRARERAARALEADLADVLTRFRETITVDDATAAVVAGDARVIVNAAVANDLEAELVAVLSESLEASVGVGTELGLRFGPDDLVDVPLSFATEGALGFIEQQAATSVLGITQTTQAGIREILSLGLTDQLAPVEVAQRIGDLAGLTPRGVRAVENFRAEITRRLVPVPEALTSQVQRVIDQEVAAMRRRQLLLRGRTIAENETQAAITAGERAFWETAIAEGSADGALVFKTWKTVQDTRVCPICEPLHGQVVRVDQPFVTSVGAIDGPPAHPRCRCFPEYGELDPDGRVPSRPDRGAGAAEAQRRRRLLDRDALQGDLGIARAHFQRTSRRLADVRPGSRAAARLEAALASSTATIRSIEARLGDFAG